MCIDTVSPPNVSRYGDISIYCCISNIYIYIYVTGFAKTVPNGTRIEIQFVA